MGIKDRCRQTAAVGRARPTAWRVHKLHRHTAAAGSSVLPAAAFETWKSRAPDMFSVTFCRRGLPATGLSSCLSLGRGKQS